MSPFVKLHYLSSLPFINITKGKTPLGGKLSREEEEEGEGKGEAVLASVGRNSWLAWLFGTDCFDSWFLLFFPFQLQNHDRQLLNIKLMDINEKHILGWGLTEKKKKKKDKEKRKENTGDRNLILDPSNPLVPTISVFGIAEMKWSWCQHDLWDCARGTMGEIDHLHVVLFYNLHSLNNLNTLNI